MGGEGDFPVVVEKGAVVGDGVPLCWSGEVGAHIELVGAEFGGPE